MSILVRVTIVMVLTVSDTDDSAIMSVLSFSLGGHITLVTVTIVVTVNIELLVMTETIALIGLW